MTGRTLTEFLLARIAEDEAACVGTHQGRSEGRIVYFLRRFDHRRIEAECKAKRRVVEELAITNPANEEYRAGLESAILALAAVYADHPDYREEWRP